MSSVLHENELTERMTGAAIEVHRVLGPGLLESAYEECLGFELSQREMQFTRQESLPVAYKAVKLDCGYRLDLIVEQRIIVEIKTVEKIMPVHEAQLLTYLKLSGLRVGLLLNFNAATLRARVKRVVHQLPESLT